MQIHELNTLEGTPGGTDFLPIDTGFDTAKISAPDLLKPVTQEVDALDTEKLNKPLDEHNQPDEGTAGQILRSKGNGATEWSDVGLPTDEQTAQAISDWLDDHPEAVTTVQDGSLTEPKFSDSLKAKTIKDYVTPQMFGAVGDGVANDTQAIMDAIDYINEQGGGTVAFPVGVYLTDPIVLSASYRDITLSGVGRSTPWKKVSTIKMRSTGDVAIQLSEANQQVPSWNATAITIKGLFIDCDNKTNIGINGNYDIRVENCVIRKAILDGIVMEGLTYPFWVKDTECSQNGRHGIYVKPVSTTVYNILDCELGNNGGYGLYIEGGNSCRIDNVVIQSNKRGGLKIYDPDPATLLGTSYLGHLLFTNLYFEANGTLDVSDANYDGNYAVKIDRYSTPGFSYTGIPYITFINCNANPSNVGDSWYVKGTAYFSSQGAGRVDVDWNENGFSFDNVDFSVNNNFSYGDYSWGSTNKYKETIVRNSQNEVLAKVGNGYIGRRGRMRELEFSISDITAGQTIQMNPINSASFMKGYGMVGNSSLYDLLIEMRRAISTGTLTFKLFWGYKSYGTKQDYLPTDPIVMSAGEPIHKIVNYNLLQYFLHWENFVGIEITASADFAFVNGSAGNNNIVAELFIES